ncbi:glycosyltransferase family 2 protein [Edwardsiella hoshinae]|uniref:Hyaluronan synthase n=1 Tax=Edwardsiella hoshinae TaxID=93378 RepID=A0A376DNN0_9GAMM|nr:glycosyltransferase family 2 protein [Edwardsiella hoshinae]QPR28774.1 glycosyltransferase family 2 protein [Edwardsiella hoshinae]STC92202.1 Hyaluronan synthase [Edwardsiella hoshinae]
MIANPILSIIIAVHNSADYILTCLQSLEQALEKNCHPACVEAIIVNDGSSDNSLEIINHFPAKNFTKKVFSVDFHNVGKVRKFAFTHCTGDYITILDSDDAFKNNSLAWVISKLKSCHCDLLITPLEEVRGKLQLQKIVITDKEKILDKNSAKNLFLDHKMIDGHISGKFIKHSLLNLDMFPDLTCYEDMVTVAYAIHNANKIVYSNTICYQLRKRENSLSDDKKGEKSLLMFDAMDKIEYFFLERPIQQHLFDALIVKAISDLISRKRIAILPPHIKNRLRKINLIKYLLCPQVRFSRKKMYLSLKTRSRAW